MFIHIAAFLIFTYLLVRLILPGALRPGAKLAAAGLLFAASQEHLFNRLFFGGLSSPELPAPVLMLQGWLFASVILLFLLVLGRDIWKISALALRAWRGRDAARRATLPRREFLKSGAAFVSGTLAARTPLASALVMAPAAYGVYASVRLPDVRSTSAFLPRLPMALDGLRLAHISDLHVSPLLGRKWTGGVVDRVNALNADLVLLTGDMVDGRTERRYASVTELRRLRSTYGVYACAGNHEYYNGFSQWMDLFSELGIRMLLNSHTVLGLRGEELVLAGVTDVAARRFTLPEPDAGAALAGAPEDKVRLLLDHRPGNAPDNAAHQVDLQLSGHTHGGHMPGLNEVVGLFNKGFVYGWYTVERMPLYVSSGAGLWNGFPIRLGVPSEMALITLRAGRAG